jgi:DNA-binding NarL/FixJ family response regulator
MDAHPEELVRALTTIQAGNLYIGTGTRPPPAAAATDNQTSTGLCSELSLLQRRVLELLANGLRNKDIAEALGTTIRTVENQREALMRRLGIKSVAGLTKHAIRTGVTSLNERLIPFPGPYSARAKQRKRPPKDPTAQTLMLGTPGMLIWLRMK